MTCLFCGKGMREGVTLHRVNPTGEKGVWVCEKDLPKTDVKVAEDVRDIIDALKGK